MLTLQQFLGRLDTPEQPMEQKALEDFYRECAAQGDPDWQRYAERVLKDYDAKWGNPMKVPPSEWRWFAAYNVMRNL